MKRPALILVLAPMLGLFACDNNDKVTNPPPGSRGER